MKDTTRDRLSNWWWDWSAVVLAIGLVIAIAALALGAVFIVGVKPDPVTYTRDEKTGLCFSHSRTTVPKVPVGGIETQTVTNVPCTEAVLRQIAATKQ